MPKIIPSLWFDGQAEAAALFYVSIFPNSKVNDVSRFGPDTPGTEASVMSVSFTLDGEDFFGLNGGPQFPFTEAVSFQIHCADQDEVDHYWDRLVEGGEPSQCGWLKDRFGLSWQVVPTALFELLSDPDPGRAQRATQAMLGMAKIEIAQLREAADQVPVA